MRKRKEPYTYKQGYAYSTCNSESSDVYMGDMYIPFDTKLIPNENGGLSQIYKKRKNQKIHILDWNDEHLYGRKILSLSDYFSEMEQYVKAEIKYVRGNHSIDYHHRYYADRNAMTIVFEKIKGTCRLQWRKGFSLKRKELYRRYCIDIDFAKEMNRILEETKETIKDDINNFLIGNSGMYYDGYYNICEILFMSDKERTYDNLTETEKFLLKRTIEYARKADSDYITDIAVMKEDGSMIPVTEINDDFFRLLFD